MFAVTDRAVLSDRVIPAEPGEFYSYTSEFTAERPVFVLMKCKANKNRPIEQLPNLFSEANIFFQFGDSTQAMAHSIKNARALSFLDSFADEKTLCETWLALSKITVEEFYEIHSCKDAAKLVDVCREACLRRQAVVQLKEGSIIAMMTSGGKYGVFLVQEMTSVSIQVVACHILL
ncbi:MAG: hypothetical protein COW88_03025 [Candidatus Lloydbacteria bacterium CG22_combo_CG10-13_8_21_14_all_47_15]|uniref:Uncharacterized protein n=1 Tax=Candidatus Lloydbacteria bacterium CG22_combo_CG10-13_8_21_14_all_47_15 TaxID=1974635 RepID=A0A2H0CTS1_9BACT|nr:MAG: hypothetical protein COW88_03025 [Candidatus Lloydbacteria bacterium CG22_combo_CG10-13_8_21_14_all_47_15]